MEGGGTCPYGSCLWFNQGCTIGCPKCGGTDGAATCGARCLRRLDNLSVWHILSLIAVLPNICSGVGMTVGPNLVHGTSMPSVH